MLNIGENIKNIRELKGFTQSVVAQELEMSQKTYSNLEKSGNHITYERILKIAEVLEIEVTKVLNLNTEAILNNEGQQGGVSQLNTASTHNYLNSEQASLFERIITEKDRLLKEKERTIELLSTEKND